ncbi:MAG: hypothetical protein ABR503_09710, partial [Chitinophagaceae bacterium]
MNGLNYDEQPDNYLNKTSYLFSKIFMQHDWSSFKLRVPTKADKASIYQAWTTQNNLEGWFLRKAAFTKGDGKERDRNSAVEVNDTYEWLWYGYGDEAMEKGKIMQANGKDFLQFSFGKAGNVSVTIKEEAGERIIELVQNEIPTDE